MKISKINLRALFSKGLKPKQEAFYNWIDSYWHKDELIDISSVKSLQNTLDNKLDLSVQNTLLTAFNEAVSNSVAGLKGEAFPNSSPTPYDPATYPDGLYEKWDVTTAGTYVNFKMADTNPVEVTTADLDSNQIQISVTNGVAKKLTSTKPQAQKKIDTWVAGSYAQGVQRIYSGDSAIYEASEAVVSTDVPGVSPKWIKKVGSTEAIKTTFTSVVKFDQKRKYSTINQSGDINFTFDPSGLEKNAMDKREIISDGIGNINFSTDFEVIGDDIDKNKNQVIFFTRESLVEFKPTACIINVAKSGQTTPIDLEPDALSYVNRIIAAGGTVSTGNQSAINNFYLNVKAAGYYSKIKGAWFFIGSNTNSRLVNAITGAPSGTLISGVVSVNGIEGIMDTNMKPSNIFTLSSFSYGFNNSTAIYTNNQSMGCRVSSTSGITCTPTTSSPGGQIFFSGPNNDVYGNTANADSTGTYVITRTGAALAKAFRNKSLLFTHTANQGSATLPTINFYVGGFNNNGTAVEDGRVLKWAFLADGLTDSEAIDISTNFDNLMSAIGR